MRKLNLVMIVFFVIIALLIVALLVGGIFYRGSSFGVIGSVDGPTSIFRSETYTSGDRQLLVDETYSADGIDMIELDLGSDAVDIHRSETGDFRVVQYGVNLQNDSIIIPSKNGSTLRVARPETSDIIIFGIRGINNNHSWVELYIPEQYHEDLSLRLSSGSMRINCDLDVDEFEAKLSSGSIRSENAIKADEAQFQLTSGSMSLGSVAAKEFAFKTSSGNMSMDALTGSGTVEITSGTVSLNQVDIAESLRVKASSGTLRMELAGDPSLEFRGQASSGSISTYFDKSFMDKHSRESFATVGDGPYKQLEVQITSGNVRITGDGSTSNDPNEPDWSGDEWDSFDEAFDDAFDEMHIAMFDN